MAGGPKTIPSCVKDWVVEPNPVDMVATQHHEASSEGSMPIHYEGSECLGTNSDGRYTEIESEDHAATAELESESHGTDFESEGRHSDGGSGHSGGAVKR